MVTLDNMLSEEMSFASVPGTVPGAVPTPIIYTWPSYIPIQFRTDKSNYNDWKLDSIESAWLSVSTLHVSYTYTRLGWVTNCFGVGCVIALYRTHY